jgi:hypothetical protein
MRIQLAVQVPRSLRGRSTAEVHVAGANLAELGHAYELSSLRAARGYWYRHSLDGVKLS